MTDIDLEAHGARNDLAEGEDAPREPRGEPDTETEEYTIWTFESETSDWVPDTYVVARDPSPLDFRMWIFQGTGDVARFVVRSSHKYGPDEQVDGGRTDCCEVLLHGQSLTGTDCPDDVAELVTLTTGAETVLPDGEPTDEADRSGPVQY